MAGKKLPKILFTIDTLALGGAELSVLELVKNISDFEVHVVVIYKANHRLQVDFECLGLKMYFFNIKDRFGFWKATYKLKKIISIVNPDIVHATHFRTEIISRLALLFSNIPLIGSLISDTYSQERYALVSQREKVKLELYKWLNRLTSFRSNLYISVSNAIVEPNKKYLWLRDSKIKIIPNGRNANLFVQAKPYIREILFPNITDDDKIIVSNSRVIKSKGFDEIFKAFHSLIENHHKVFLLIIGEGSELDNYRDFCEKEGFSERVSFLGSRLDMAELLKSSDLFWFASHYEGSPGVVIEGMLAQIPIVASNIGPVTENLIHEENALLFEKGNWKDLENQTVYLLNNWHLKDSLVSNAYQLATEKFDIVRIAKEHEKVYQNLINP